METTKGLKTDNYGRVLVTSSQLRELLLQGKNIDSLVAEYDEDIELYKKFSKDLLESPAGILEPDESKSFDDFHDSASASWMIPAEYQQIDVETWLLDKCKTAQEINRVKEEFILFQERNLVPLLRLFIFLVDHMRKNKIVWGVGRGSSVSSYILYLIGIHRVDSIKYNLSISEFLK